jgi:hypothetical protein
MLQPNSVKLTELSATLRNAVKDIDASSISFLHHPTIIGFVAPLDQFKGQSLQEIADVADRVKEAAGDLAGPSNVLIHGPNVTIGFVMNQQLLGE